MIKPAVDSVDALSVSADPNEVRRASAWLERICLERGVSAEQTSRLDLCLNETLANIIAHGGPTARSSPVHLQFRFHRKPGANEAELSISDTGIAFDPVAFQPKPSPQTLSETEPGDLGLIMMRSYADDVSYRYSEGRNQLTFRICWAEPG